MEPANTTQTTPVRLPITDNDPLTNKLRDYIDLGEDVKAKRAELNLMVRDLRAKYDEIAEMCGLPKVAESVPTPPPKPKAAKVVKAPKLPKKEAPKSVEPKKPVKLVFD